jgi:hypothetical protein
MRVPLALVLSVMLIPALGLAGVAPAPAQPLQASPVPLWGIVLGTVIVAGLLYLIVHGPDGDYYRYPYYGSYYRVYYRPGYRPYTGFYPAAAPVIVVAPPIVGAVLGVVVINHVQYLLSRDASGHLYRYPYYGPYRHVYYRPTYRSYHGAYVTNGAYRRAPLRQGDPRWDNDKRNLAPAFQWPRPRRQPTPAYRQPQRQAHPASHQPPQQPSQTRRQPQQQPHANPHGGRSPSGGSRNQTQQCGHPGQQPCPNHDQHP